MSKIEILLKQPTKEFLGKIEQITSLKEIEIKEINESVKKIAKEIGEDITTTQLRKVYGEIKRLQRGVFDESKLYMLETRLAYAFARGEQRADIYAISKKCYPKIKDKEDLNRFAYILEALVAYHKYEKELREELRKRGE